MAKTATDSPKAMMRRERDQALAASRVYRQEMLNAISNSNALGKKLVEAEREIERLKVEPNDDLIEKVKAAIKSDPLVKKLMTEFNAERIIESVIKKVFL